MSNQFMRVTGHLLAAVMLWSACQFIPATVTPESPGTLEPVVVTPTFQSSSESTLATGAATIPGPLEHGFKLYIDEPVLQMGPSGTWDSGLMDPGAVVFHENQFHMFYDAVPSFPALIDVGYSVSPDGITWTRAVTQPVFTKVNIPWRPQPTNFRANSVIVVDGTWVLYFSTTDSYRKLTGLVGRATASAPTGPWTVDPEPVLKPGGNGEWDSGDVGHVDVIPIDHGYVMYYSGKLGIGMATSPDGIQWTKYDDPATSKAPFVESNPVIAIPAPMGEHDPNVVYTHRGWQMVYRSDPGLEYATGPDEIDWLLASEKPLISSVDLAKTIWYSAFIVHGERAYLYFEAGNRNTSIYLADWTEQHLE